MARVSPGEGDIQARRLSNIDWPQASRTHHEMWKGSVSSSAVFGPRTPLARHTVATRSVAQVHQNDLKNSYSIFSLFKLEKTQTKNVCHEWFQ